MTAVPDTLDAALELLTGFLNTVDVDEGTDELADAASATRWFAERDLLGPGDGFEAGLLAQAVELRTAMRELAIAHHEPDSAAAGADRFAAAARAFPLVAAADAGGEVRLLPAGAGAAGALGHVVVAAAEASIAGLWPRLKICPADDCAWAFVDRSKNRSRRWCDMGVCGNRQKSRSYRARHRETSG